MSHADRKKTSYTRDDGNVLRAAFGTKKHIIDSRDRLATAIFTHIADDVSQLPDTGSIRASIDAALSRITPATTAKGVKAAINHEVTTNLARANCIQNRESLLLPRNWEDTRPDIFDQTRHIRSYVRLNYRGALVALIDPESSVTSKPLFSAALQDLNEDWNCIRASIMATPTFSRIAAYLGPTIENSLLPNPAIDLPKEASDVVATFYNLLTVFGHLKAVAEKPGVDPSVRHMLTTMTTQVMKVHKEVRAGIMTYDSGNDRSRGQRNKWAHTMHERMTPTIILFSNTLQEILGVSSTGSVVLTDFKNDHAANTAVRNQKHARQSSFAAREKELLAFLEDLVHIIETDAIDRTPLYQKVSQWSADMEADLAEAMAITLDIEITQRKGFQSKVRKALAVKKSLKKTS